MRVIAWDGRRYKKAHGRAVGFRVVRFVRFVTVSEAYPFPFAIDPIARFFDANSFFASPTR